MEKNYNGERLPVPASIADQVAALTSEQLEQTEQVQVIHKEILGLLSRTGMNVKIGEDSVRVSSVAVPTKIEGKTFYARAYASVQPDELFGGKKTMTGILLDETKDKDVITRDYYGIRIVDGVLAVGGNTINKGGSDPEVNEGATVAYVAQTVQLLKGEADALDMRKERERAGKLRTMRTIARRTVYSTLAAGALGASIYGLIQVPWSSIGPDDERDYDRNTAGLALAGGTPVHIGETVEPQFSADLIANPSFGADKMPELSDQDVNDNYNDPMLAVDDGFRQVTVSSSHEGKNCETGVLKVHTPLDSEFRVWTDFATAEGQSRASELQVSLLVGQVRVCWKGQETGPDDDPRVVIRPLATIKSAS